MVVLIVLFGASLAAGLFFLTADLLRLPYLKTSKAMINTGREKKDGSQNRGNLSADGGRQTCSLYPHG